MLLKRVVLGVLMALPIVVNGQIEEAIEQWVEREGSTAQAADMYDQLAALREHPVNLNDTASLDQLPLLTPFQVRAIKNYIILYGEMLTVEELRYVPGMDSGLCAMLRPLIKLEPMGQKQRLHLRDGSHSVVAGIGGTLEQAAGYGDGRYEGDNLHALLRYRYSCSNRIEWQLAADKDPTEAWGKGNFYSYHLMVRDVGIVETAILGRYNLQYGQGLTLWTGMQPFDIAGNTSMRYGRGIKAASAFNEEGYQEGLATTLNLTHGLHLSAFGSKCEGVGLAGGHLEWRRDNWSVGTTLTHCTYEDSIRPRNYVYNQNVFRGEQMTNWGIDGCLQYHHATLHGEVAIDAEGHLSGIGGLDLSTGQQGGIALQYRYFHPLYHNPHAQAYGIGSTQGEQGLRIDLRSQLPMRIQGSASIDLHQLLTLRYANYRPSEGVWLRAQLKRTIGRHLEASVKYLYQDKMRNIPNYDSALYVGEECYRRQLKAEMRYNIGNWTMRARYALVAFDSENSDSQVGQMLAIDIRYTRPRWQVLAATAVFNTDGYYGRIFLTESNLQYMWSMPALYGKGIRTSLLVRYTPSRRVSAAAKYTITYYPDLTSIGSGANQTEGPIRQTLQFQIAWKILPHNH